MKKLWKRLCAEFSDDPEAFILRPHERHAIGYYTNKELLRMTVALFIVSLAVGSCIFMGTMAVRLICCYCCCH